MTAMLAPDLLDRRALALLRFVDVAGAPVRAPLRIEGAAVRLVAKSAGDYALLSARDLEAYTAAFDAAPGSPAPGTVKLRLDVTPASSDVAPRSFVLPLPRDPDPTRRDAADSVFLPVPVELLPGASAEAPPGGCSVRVTVRRADDGRLIEHALVRGRSDNGAFAARALTDARGEACLVFTGLPLAFAKSGGGVQPVCDARATVAVDPSTALFHAPADIAAAQDAAAARTAGHPDPDAFAGAAPAAFAAGTAVTLAAGARRALAIAWSPA
ncbi:MAG: hypothetical protein JO013_10205 [Alphaproteobacteria bacterium]|nr:hypothetical protein [Alphaproteobacteria bacterium]